MSVCVIIDYREKKKNFLIHVWGLVCVFPPVYKDMPKGDLKAFRISKREFRRTPLSQQRRTLWVQTKEKYECLFRSYCLTLIIYASKEVLQVSWCFLTLHIVVLLRGILYIVVSGCIIFYTHYILWCSSQNILYLGCIIFYTPRGIIFYTPRCIRIVTLTIPN